MQKKPRDIKSLILTSPFLSGELFKRDVARLLDGIQPGISQKIPQLGSETYAELEEKFYARHLSRLTTLPRDMRVTEELAGRDVYEALQGPSEFDMSGKLAEYDARDRLSDVTIPVLYTCGRYNETTPESTALFQSLTPHSEMVDFENSTHMAQFEERDLFVRTIADFISRVTPK